MNKTMEYMSFRLPVVAFDLKETKFSAGQAAVYVRTKRRRRVRGCNPAGDSTIQSAARLWAISVARGSKARPRLAPSGAEVCDRLRVAHSARENLARSTGPRRELVLPPPLEDLGISGSVPGHSGREFQ